MKLQITECYCDVCGEKYLEKELANFILPVRDYVADSYGGGPNVHKKQGDVCLKCQISIGESIARLKPKAVKP